MTRYCSKVLEQLLTPNLEANLVRVLKKLFTREDEKECLIIYESVREVENVIKCLEASLQKITPVGFHPCYNTRVFKEFSKECLLWSGILTKKRCPLLPGKQGSRVEKEC